MTKPLMANLALLAALAASTPGASPSVPSVAPAATQESASPSGGDEASASPS